MRFAEKGKVYRVPFVVGGETVTFHLKSLSIAERDELRRDLIEAEKTGGVKGLTEELANIIQRIDGVDGPVPAALASLEHAQDIRDIVRQVYEWCLLDEQTEKNWSSSREPSGQASAGASADSIAQPDDEPASITPMNAAGPQPAGRG